MTSEIEEMKAGREMDALVAEKVMGWSVVHFIGADERHGFNLDATNYYKSPDEAKRSDLASDWSYWSPSTDGNINRQMELRIKELGLELEEEYIWQLLKLVTGRLAFPSKVSELIALLYASNEQKCKAALKAVAAKESK